MRACAHTPPLPRQRQRLSSGRDKQSPGGKDDLPQTHPDIPLLRKCSHFWKSQNQQTLKVERSSELRSITAAWLCGNSGWWYITGWRHGGSSCHTAVSYTQWLSGDTGGKSSDPLDLTSVWLSPGSSQLLPILSPPPGTCHKLQSTGLPQHFITVEAFRAFLS